MTQTSAEPTSEHDRAIRHSTSFRSQPDCVITPSSCDYSLLCEKSRTSSHM